MTRHYCDVCGTETNGGTNVIINNVDLSDMEKFIKILEPHETGIYRELCRRCARKIAIYITVKCKDDE